MWPQCILNCKSKLTLLLSTPVNIIDICYRYREELAHQASVVQRQEETIQSLMKQVCCLSALYSPDYLKCIYIWFNIPSRCLLLCDIQVELLLNWKTESETSAKIKAATLIQKYWYEHVNHFY